MDESEVLRDILGRLTQLTEHVVEIKSDMILRSEHQADKDRIYSRIAEVQEQMIQATKDLASACDRRFSDLESKVKPRVPGWLIAIASAILSGVGYITGQQIVRSAEGALHINN